MADKKEKQEKQDNPAGEKASKNKASGKKLLIFGLLGLLVVGGGAGGGAYYLGQKSVVDSVTAESATTADQALLPSEAVYVAIDPAFTVNFQDGGKADFLQLSLEAMTRDPAVAELIKLNLPLIRNNLVLILSSKTSDDLSTSDGKEALRNETLAGIQEIVRNEGGAGEVEAVYFTSFVMQ